LARTWKSAKRRQWRMMRAGFEEAARFSRLFGVKIVNAATVTSEFTIEIYFVPCAARNSERLGLFAALGRQMRRWWAENFASIAPVCAVSAQMRQEMLFVIAACGRRSWLWNQVHFSLIGEEENL